MRASRGFCIWSALTLCGVMVLGAMSWLTRSVLASERDRAMAESRADLEERTRLALWRMDAVGAAILLGENQRPPAFYAMESDPFEPGYGDPVVKLHFEIRQDGRLRSPEVGMGSGLPPEARAEGVGRLRDLQALLSSNPVPGDELKLLSCAVEIGENAWQAVSKNAAEAKISNNGLRMKQSASSNRGDLSYQTNFNEVEKAQRAKAVGQSFENGSNSIPQQQAIQVDRPQSPGGRVIGEIGPMRAVWIGGELFLLRQLTSVLPEGQQKDGSSVEKGIQGVWLNATELRRRLLAEVVDDLLPKASLANLPGGSDPLALVSFPLLLERNESITTAAAPMSVPLLVGWAAVIVALVTASMLVRGVMRLSERRASFVSAVTHELRTPLTTFRLYSDMLQSGAVKEEKRGTYLSVLSREADRLSHLVENVLAFSQIERGSARSVVRVTTAAELLEPMRERFESRLSTAGMSLVMDLTVDAAQRPMKVDAPAVEHILFNLIDNAAKYASSGQPPLVMIRIVQSDRRIGIEVADHGPGIAPGEGRRIFQAFHKSAHEAAETKPGVGLGLALSRRLARSLGGELSCESRETGACFVLSIPEEKP
jgi:signal transduction histidine kinase